MSHSEPWPELETVEATFQRMDACIEQAREVIPVARVSQLISLLPEGSLESQRFILGELIKLDMGTAAEMGQIRELDHYLPDCQRWYEQGQVPIDLVLEEVQIRKDSGDSPNLTEYQKRFPQWADALANFRWAPSQSQSKKMAGGLIELESGRLIDDFRILRLLGRGAFAHVYLARQESMQRLVALKVSTISSQEPQTLSQLDHPNIVRVYDQRELPAHQLYLLYMQVVLGGTLAKVIRSTMELDLSQLQGARLLHVVDQALVEVQQLPPDRGDHELHSMCWAATTAWIGAQLADGLQAAHDQGVYHHDVKPANILLSASGAPLLADFNVSVNHSSSEQMHSLGGTLAYMSPEHLNAAKDPSLCGLLDQRSDLYALALVLWELWQGQRPWQSGLPAPDWQAALDQQSKLRLRPLEARRKDTSAAGGWLERVLRHALQPDPSHRPQSCQELATRLRLAHHPRLAARFAPADGTFLKRLVRTPVLLITALIAFATNGPAGVLNYNYNRIMIIDKFEQMQAYFSATSTALNAIAFSFSGILLALFCWRVRLSLNRAAQGSAAVDSDLDWVWRFGHRAAVVCGSMWLLFGIIFPLTMRYIQPSFGWQDFTHFFMSLAICGGMALIYPFFGISLLATYVYYPQLIAPTMRDPNFSSRAQWLSRLTSRYLVMSAVVPLLAIGLLTMFQYHEYQENRTESANTLLRYLQILLVGLTLFGLFVSFQAHQLLLRVIDQYDDLLGGRSSQT